MQISNGEIPHFNPGDINLVEDTTGKGHTTWDTSKEAALLARIELPG
jgi:hypothetical protein